MPNTARFIKAAAALAPQLAACADESERARRLPLPLVEAMARAGLFRLWIPRTLGGEETDPMTLVRVVEEVARADGAAGWCLAIGGEYGVFGGYLPPDAAHEIYGTDPLVITGGTFRPTGQAVIVDGGYRVTGRWPLGSGCQHSAWIVGGCRILDGDRLVLGPDGVPVMRLMFFPASSCEILDTWHSIGLRGTGSHDYAVTDLFVPAARSLSFREPPSAPGPLYALPTCFVRHGPCRGPARHRPSCNRYLDRVGGDQDRHPLTAGAARGRHDARRSGTRRSVVAFRSRLPLRGARPGMAGGNRGADHQRCAAGDDVA